MAEKKLNLGILGILIFVIFLSGTFCLQVSQNSQVYSITQIIEMDGLFFITLKPFSNLLKMMF